MQFRACDRKWEFPRPTLVMGIVNVTPDSFSDGGKFASADQVVEHALRLAAEGADILDIGGESSRPGAESVDESVELGRVIPVIKKLADQTETALSMLEKQFFVDVKEAIFEVECASTRFTLGTLQSGLGDVGDIIGTGKICFN